MEGSMFMSLMANSIGMLISANRTSIYIMELAVIQKWYKDDKKWKSLGCDYLGRY